MIPLMARAATTSDAFNAVAEPRRRDILYFLAVSERPVSDIVEALSLPSFIGRTYRRFGRCTSGLVSSNGIGGRS